MKKFRHLLTNKYAITGTAFAVWMMFFDTNDIPLQIRRMRELNKIERNEKIMSLQIVNTQNELQSLKSDPATLEKYAREKYMMKKDNEDLYIITFDSSQIR